jgi:hypothetical protein
MNFCGGSVEQQVVVLSQDELDSRIIVPRHLCCARPDDDDEDEDEEEEHEPAPPTKEIITTTSIPITRSSSRKNANVSRMNSVWSGSCAEDEDESLISKRPVALALDVIEHALRSPNDPKDEEKQLLDLTNSMNATTIGAATPVTTRTIPTHQQQQQQRRIDTSLNSDGSNSIGGARTPSPIIGGRTPSPMFLNPLSSRAGRRNALTEARKASKITTAATTPLSANRSNTNTKLLYPDLSGAKTLESLMKRLQAGFNVRLLQDRRVGPVFLYLHYDRSRLCIIRRSSGDESNYDGREEKKVIDEWIELPISKILRLEVGKTSHPLASSNMIGNNKYYMTFFSIVVNQDANIMYYDFEADSPLEREVLVSTLMVVLDQAQNPTLQMSQQPPLTTEQNSYHDICMMAEEDLYHDVGIPGGTMDQPIPCSPSLEIVDSDSLPTLSPRKRTHIYDGDSIDGTETSLAVIHLEHVDSAPLLPTVGEFNTVTSFTGEPSLSFVTEASFDVSRALSTARTSPDDATSIVANKLELDAGAQHLAGGWACGADTDICTLALRDLAETCSGIFVRRETSSEVEKRVMIEEYIASALGSPSAMYNYLTEGDVWKAESAPAEEDQGEKGGTRIRNRASLLNAQAGRLRTLRNEMTFAAALKQSKERMHFVQTTQSFDDASRTGKGRKDKAATEVANRFHTSALLQHVVGNMMFSDQGISVEEAEEEVAYYDSDPEDARPRTMKKGPRRVSAERLNRVEDEKEESPRHQALSGVGFENVTSNKKVSKRLDEEVIVEIVQVRVSCVLVGMERKTNDSTQEKENSPLQLPNYATGHEQ